MKQLPIPSDELLRQAFRIIELEDKNNVKRNSQIYLTAPNGTQYYIIVSDTGTIGTNGDAGGSGARPSPSASGAFVDGGSPSTSFIDPFFSVDFGGVT